MDPITTPIVAALTAGVTGGATEIGKQGLVDAYAALKTLLSKKFGHTSEVVKSVESLESRPDSSNRQGMLAEEITTVHADQDPEIVQAAQKLHSLIQPQQAAMGNKYNVQITGDVHGYAQGDHQQVTMNFGPEPREH